MTDQRDRTVVPMPTRPTSSPRTEPLDPLWREVAGAALRDRRLASGRTLREVAERAGVSPQYLSEVERGRKEPSSEMLASICGALGWELVDLLTAAGHAVGAAAQPVGGRFTVVRLARPANRPAPGGLTGPVLLAG